MCSLASCCTECSQNDMGQKASSLHSSEKLSILQELRMLVRISCVHLYSNTALRLELRKTIPYHIALELH